MERIVAQQVRAQRVSLRFPRTIPAGLFLLVTRHAAEDHATPAWFEEQAAIRALATNAATHGALSAPGGEVAVDSALVADRPREFGTELIDKIVADELRNPLDPRFGRAAVERILMVPVRGPARFQTRAGARAARRSRMRRVSRSDGSS
ncbi:hypothetical protein ACFOON_03745 [Novosphingobium piscinae]|uniref:Uncharacterized protein n=1 Tax=Novosphingobium piscinae TaxID=1507448 RepID=A0A7X1KQR0_9SPHN|nr:hypothetical protein [Novosphingobium piscinae]MBC2669974.1 hypothetical protein [Novosphingobium piscinae]